MININRILKLSFVLIISGIIFSCSKNEETIKHCKGNIIGFDPCSIINGISTGYVIISSDKKLTLKTYNLPDSIYTYKKEYFFDYQITSYFPALVRDSFPITISYTIADKNKMVYPLCIGDINISEFNNALQVIIKSASKN